MRWYAICMFDEVALALFLASFLPGCEPLFIAPDTHQAVGRLVKMTDDPSYRIVSKGKWERDVTGWLAD